MAVERMVRNMMKMTERAQNKSMREKQCPAQKGRPQASCMQKKDIRITELEIERASFRPVCNWSSVGIQLEFPVAVSNPDEKSSARTQKRSYS